mgnify:CR=1 FL=1|jgi:hypothetical protein
MLAARAGFYLARVFYIQSKDVFCLNFDYHYVDREIEAKSSSRAFGHSLSRAFFNGKLLK